MINVDDVVKALTPIIEDNCACCDESTTTTAATTATTTKTTTTTVMQNNSQVHNHHTTTTTTTTTTTNTTTTTKDCQDGWDHFPHTNKCYKHFNYSTIITWMDAQHTCRQFGGNLPTINDNETNQFVSNLVGGASNWIGAYRVGPSNDSDQFAWIDGPPLVYAPWV